MRSQVSKPSAYEGGVKATALQGIGYDANGPSSALPAQVQNAESITYLGNTTLELELQQRPQASHRR